MKISMESEGESEGGQVDEFNLKDYKIKKVSFWEKVDKKKFIIIVLLFVALFLLITIIILVVLLSGGNDSKEEGEKELPSIGEIICEYLVLDSEKNTKCRAFPFFSFQFLSEASPPGKRSKQTGVGLSKKRFPTQSDTGSFPPHEV